MKSISVSKKAAAALVILSLFAGCAEKGQTIQPGDKTKSGALLGALAGATLGALTSKHHKGKNAIIGAAAGAALGGAIGYNMDKQAAQIAKSLDTDVATSPGAELDASRDIIVTKTDRFVKITFRDRMMFPTNSAMPTPTAQQKIERLINVLQNYPQTIIQVVGHTDSRGKYDYNLELSRKRALTVANLIKDSGIPNPVYARGCSFDKPLAPNTTPENMALNRRVEVYLYPSRDFVVDQCR